MILVTGLAISQEYGRGRHEHILLLSLFYISGMERQHRPIDKEFEEADYTGVLTITGRNLRHFPNFTDDFCDPVEVFEAGM